MMKIVTFFLIVSVAGLLYAAPSTETTAPREDATAAVAIDAQEVYPFTRAGNFPYPPYDDPKLFGHWRETLGVDWNIRYLEQQTQREQLNLLIASGEVPDVMSIAFPEIASFKDQGVVGGWDEAFFREWAPNVAKAIDEWGGEEAWAYAKLDGKMYTIPQFNYNARFATPNVIRTDWLRAVGIDAVPATIAEAEAAFTAFTRQDPDGNGRDDTYGLSEAGLSAIYGAYGFQPKMWLERDDGTLAYGSGFPEAREALELLAKWYADGILDPEYVTGENTGGYWALTHAFANGRIGFTGMAGWYHWSPEGVEAADGGPNVQLFRSINPDGEYAIIAPFTGPEGKSGTVSWFPLALGTVLSKELVDDPERLAKLFTFIDHFSADPRNMLTGMHGFEGEDWSLDDSGGFSLNPDGGMTTPQDRFGHGGEYMSILYFHPEFIMDTVYAPRFAWGAEEFAGKNIGYTNKIPVPLASDTRYKAEGDKLLDEGFHQIITGQRPISYFDEMVTQWNAIGGSQLTEEANAWHASFKANL